MCVIAVCDMHRPNEKEIRAMFEKNSHGMGVAWREKKEDGSRIVKWTKGVMNIDDAVAIIPTIPLPFICHFRVASIGGVHKLLTHPFCVDSEATSLEDGEFGGEVLFHNGHWSAWDSVIKDASFKSHFKIPGGHWNDTRAMAWIYNHFGPGMLELIDEKVCTINPEGDDDDCIKFWGKGWQWYKRVNQDDSKVGFLVSNSFWEGGLRKESRPKEWQQVTDRRLPQHYQGPRTEKETSSEKGKHVCFSRDCSLQCEEGSIFCKQCNRGRTPSTRTSAAKKEPGGVPLDETPFLEILKRWHFQKPLREEAARINPSGKWTWTEGAKDDLGRGMVSKSQFKKAEKMLADIRWRNQVKRQKLEREARIAQMVEDLKKENHPTVVH